jgi:hypothetical protein
VINVGSYERAAQTVLEALALQESQATHLGDIVDSKESLEGGGVTSDVLWETLRMTFGLSVSERFLSIFFSVLSFRNAEHPVYRLNRGDLAAKCQDRDLRAFA